MHINPGSINLRFTARWPEESRNAHNAESMMVGQAVRPIIDALYSQFVVNRLAYESLDQGLGELGVLPRRDGH